MAGQAVPQAAVNCRLNKSEIEVMLVIDLPIFPEPRNDHSGPLIPASVWNWATSQPPVVGLAMLRSWTHGEPMLFPGKVEDNKKLARCQEVAGDWLRIISACKQCWPDRTASGAAAAMTVAAGKYQDGGCFRRNLSMRRVPATEPEITIHQILVSNEGRQQLFPSQDRIRKKLSEAGWSKFSKK